MDRAFDIFARTFLFGCLSILGWGVYHIAVNGRAQPQCHQCGAEQQVYWMDTPRGFFCWKCIKEVQVRR